MKTAESSSMSNSTLFESLEAPDSGLDGLFADVVFPRAEEPEFIVHPTLRAFDRVAATPSSWTDENEDVCLRETFTRDTAAKSAAKKPRATTRLRPSSTRSTTRSSLQKPVAKPHVETPEIAIAEVAIAEVAIAEVTASTAARVSA